MLSNMHLMEGELLSNVVGTEPRVAVSPTLTVNETVASRPVATNPVASTPTIDSVPQTVQPVPTVSTPPVATSPTGTRPVSDGQTILKNPETVSGGVTVVNVSREPTGVPVMIDPVVGAGASPVVTGGGGFGGGGGGGRAAEEEEEVAVEEKKSYLWLYITLAVVAVGGYYALKK